MDQYCASRESIEVWDDGRWMLCIVRCLDESGESIQDPKGIYWEYTVNMPREDITQEIQDGLRDPKTPGLARCHNWGYDFDHNVWVKQGYTASDTLEYTEFEFNICVPDQFSRWTQGDTRTTRQVLRDAISESVSELRNL